MKKRVKLFTTIASLCLAVALMAFGVYAATSESLKINSSVSFESTTVLFDAKVDITGAVEGAKSKTYTADNKLVEQNFEDFEVGALTFDEGHRTITYTVKFTNKSNFAITIGVTGAPSAVEGQLEVTETKTALTSIAKGAPEVTYTLVLNLARVDSDLTSTVVNLVFTATKAA